MTEEIVAKYVRNDDILFVLSNENDENSISSDTDIYCVTSGSSSVHLSYDKNQEWVELFIDNISDLKAKIANVDEIALNFIRELKFVSGDIELYQSILAEVTDVISNYVIPEYRVNILKYRIKVLLTKYLNPDPSSDIIQENFILNAMAYPLIQLIFLEHKIFPLSPKKWISQLENELAEVDFLAIRSFINRQCSHEDVIKLCDRYAGGLEDIDIDKKVNNNLTFIT